AAPRGGAARRAGHGEGGGPRRDSLPSVFNVRAAAAPPLPRRPGGEDHALDHRRHAVGRARRRKGLIHLHRALLVDGLGVLILRRGHRTGERLRGQLRPSLQTIGRYAHLSPADKLSAVQQLGSRATGTTSAPDEEYPRPSPQVCDRKAKKERATGVEPATASLES